MILQEPIFDAQFILDSADYIQKNQLPVRGGFIHVPYIAQQVIGKKNVPFMELTTITKGLEAAIRAIKNYEVDLKVSGGKEC